MADFSIVRAQRSQARLRLALTAPSGGGKTWSALVVAKGICEALLQAGLVPGTIEGKIGVIDTERRSAQLYSHLVPFDTIELGPPYTVPRYLSALRQFDAAGYLVVIIDQVTHAWSGEGGLLEMAGKAKAQSAYGGFDVATPEYQRFVDGILAANSHVICTMRQKTSWDLEEYVDKQGRTKKRPVRLGLAPQMRAGFEYEFTTLLGLEVKTNLATVLKDRSGVFPADEPFRLSEDWGRQLTGWLTTGAVMTPGEIPVMERIEAATVAVIGRMSQAKNGPDLARVYDAGYREVRRFAGEIEASQVQPFLKRLEWAKDEEKKRFPDLQGAYARAQVEAEAQRKVEADALKPCPNGAQALVDQEHARRHGTDLLAAPAPPGPPADAFAGMEDDLPWKDD